MKFQLSNTIYSLKFAMEKNDFERLESSNGKKRNECCQPDNNDNPRET